MPTPVVRDAVAHAVQVLASLPAPVRGFRRGDPAGRAVIVRDTGGPRVTPAHTAHQMTVTAWGKSPDDDTAARALAADALALIEASEGGNFGGAPCSAVLVVSIPYPDPDSVTGRARYSFTVRVTLRNLNA